MSDSDRLTLSIFIGITYVVFVWLSIETMTSIPEEFERNPWLIDKKWKRALWIISCLIYTPLWILASRAPRYLFSEIKDFIMESNNTREGNNGNEDE